MSGRGGSGGEKVKPKVSLKSVRTVKVADGPFPKPEWRVEEIDPGTRENARLGDHFRPGDA